MKTQNLTLIFIFLSCIFGFSQIEGLKLNGGVKVVDEAGKPVAGANVRVWFTVMKTSNVFDGTQTEGVSGVSNEKGEFDAIHSSLGEFGANVEKEGYYIGRSRRRLDKGKDGNWEPFQQVIEVKLRKKESPIPMYAKKLNGIMLPSATDSIGYDLMIGDWVSPHGKGMSTDVVVTLEREYQDSGNFSWKLTLQGAKEGDGFSPIMPEQESPQSELRFPRHAPADSYSNPLALGLKYAEGKAEYTNTGRATNFFFRVRTELDEHKQVKHALYGKLIGPIEVQLHYVKTGKLNFTYYLNPTPLDRNMEFDPKQNLFKKLSSMERVNAP